MFLNSATEPLEGHPDVVVSIGAEQRRILAHRVHLVSCVQRALSLCLGIATTLCERLTRTVKDTDEGM